MEKYINEQSTDGNVKIADDVTAKIAIIAAFHVGEVYYSSKDLMNGVADVVGKLGVKTPARKVKVTVGEGEGIIDLSLSIEYGRNILDIYNGVQEKAKGSIENVTGLSIIEVNVHVVGTSAPTGELLAEA